MRHGKDGEAITFKLPHGSALVDWTMAHANARWEVCPHNGDAAVAVAGNGPKCITVALPHALDLPLSGSHVYATGVDTLRLWDLEQKKLLASYQAGFVVNAAVSHDGRYAAIVRTADAPFGKPVQKSPAQLKQGHSAEVFVVDLQAVPTVKVKEMPIDKDMELCLKTAMLGNSTDHAIQHGHSRAGSWKKAADGGDPKGQFLYGQALLCGAGCTLNLTEARAFLEKAADKQIGAAEALLGFMQVHGLGFENRNLIEGKNRLERAKGQGYVPAYYHLAKAAAVVGDTTQAINLYEAAAEKGHLPSMHELSKMNLQKSPDWENRFKAGLDKALTEKSK